MDEGLDTSDWMEEDRGDQSKVVQPYFTNNVTCTLVSLFHEGKPKKSEREKRKLKDWVRE